MIAPDVCRRALALSRQDFSVKQIGEELGLATMRAKVAIALGRVVEEASAAQLTPAEQLLVWSVQQCADRNFVQELVRSPTSREVAAMAGRGRGWPAACASRRLHDGPKGLGLVHVAGNGHLWLTPLGQTVAGIMKTPSQP